MIRVPDSPAARSTFHARAKIIKTLIRAAALLLILTGLQQPAFADEPACKQRKAELPVTVGPGNRPMLAGKINGQDAHFLIDSGAFWSTMASATAEMYHLSPHPAPYGLYMVGVGGRADVQVAKIRDLEMAGYTIHNVDFLVGGSVGGAGSGLIGQNMLANWDVEYDMAHGMVRLLQTEGKACKKTWLAYWTPVDQASVLKIETPREARFHTVGTMLINNTKIDVVFDTGASTSVLTRHAAEKAGIKLDDPKVVSVGVSSGLGRSEVRSYIATFASFKVGDAEEIKNSRIRVLDGDLPGGDMLLGEDFILSHHVLVANSQRSMYITYIGGPVFNVSNRPTEAPKPAEKAEGAEGPPAAAAAAPTVPAESLSAEEFSRRGNASAARRDFEPAIADLNHACELSPDNPEYLYQRALIYMQAGKGDLALSDLDRVIQLKSDFLPAYIPRAQLHRAKHEDEAALADLQTVDHLSPPQADLRFELGNMYMSIRKFPEAIVQYDTWMKSHEVDSRLVRALAERCFASALQNQDVSTGMSDCNRALRLESKKNPFYPEILASRGFADIREEKFDKAIEDFSDALKLQPTLARAYYGRGVAESRQHKQAQSDTDIAEAAKRAPKMAELYKGWGLSP